MGMKLGSLFDGSGGFPLDVFAQPYRDFENNTEHTNEQKAFARYMNRKEIFKSIETFAEYKRK